MDFLERSFRQFAQGRTNSWNKWNRQMLYTVSSISPRVFIDDITFYIIVTFDRKNAWYRMYFLKDHPSKFASTMTFSMRILIQMTWLDWTLLCVSPGHMQYSQYIVWDWRGNITHEIYTLCRFDYIISHKQVHVIYLFISYRTASLESQE